MLSLTQAISEREECTNKARCRRWLVESQKYLRPIAASAASTKNRYQRCARPWVKQVKRILRRRARPEGSCLVSTDERIAKSRSGERWGVYGGESFISALALAQPYRTVAQGTAGSDPCSDGIGKSNTIRPSAVKARHGGS